MVKKALIVLLVSLVLGGSIGFFYQRKQVRPKDKVASVALEFLLEEAAKVSQRQAEFSLFVPERLTFKGQPFEQNAAISVLTDALLAKEMTPVESVEIGNGRLIQYQALDVDALKRMQSE